MFGKDCALYSAYTIDGVRRDFTPAQLLDPMTGTFLERDSGNVVLRHIVDETLEPELKSIDLDYSDIAHCLSLVQTAERHFPFTCSDSYTRLCLASALIDTLWKTGHFRLGDLLVTVAWHWNERPVGAMAAFYESVQAAADYVDALNLRFKDYRYSRSVSNTVNFKLSLSNEDLSDEETVIVEPYRSQNPRMGQKRICPSQLVDDERSWVIYLPFDTADFRLGGSLLAQALGLGGAPPAIGDADYFMDCYEVLREFAEDGILLSAATVGEGGLLRALNGMTGNGIGLRADVSDIVRMCDDGKLVPVLFSELPGVVFQVRDSDFDYVDAELLLQDVLYFPLGHPVSGGNGVDVVVSAKSKIQTILESLMQNAEGED